MTDIPSNIGGFMEDIRCKVEPEQMLVMPREHYEWMQKRITELEAVIAERDRLTQTVVEMSLKEHQMQKRVEEAEEALREIKATSVRMTMPEWGRIDRLVDEAMKGGGK